MIDRVVSAAAKGAVAAVRKSVPNIVDTVMNELFAHPAYAVIAGGQLRLMEAGVAPREAWDMSRECLRQFLADEKVEFGDNRYAWTADSGREIVEDYEIDHWESRS